MQQPGVGFGSQRKLSRGWQIALIAFIFGFPVVAGLTARYLENRGDRAFSTAEPEEAARPPAAPAPASTEPSPEPSEAEPEPERADYSGQKLRNATFHGDELLGADFSRATLVRGKFAEAVLRDASFRGADLTGASFRSADLRNADLSQADLSSADLSYARLVGAELSGATLDETRFVGATGVTNSMLAEATGLRGAALASYAQAHRIVLDDAFDIESALGGLCSGKKGIPGTAPYPGGASFHPAIVVNEPSSHDDSTNNWPGRAHRLRWTPVGLRFAQLVICVKEIQPKTTANCGIYSGPGFNGAVYNKAIQYRVSVYAARDRRLIDQRILQGASPPLPCPDSIYGGVYFTAGPPSFEAALGYLSGIVGSPPTP